MLADAETDEEEDAALLFVCLILEENRRLLSHSGGRYGRGGAYNRKKSKDFFDLLLYSFSERWFKSWMRYAFVLSTN